MLTRALGPSGKKIRPPRRFLILAGQAGDPSIAHPFPTTYAPPERLRHEGKFRLSQACEKARKKRGGATLVGHFGLTPGPHTLYSTPASSVRHLAKAVADGPIAQRESTCLTSRGSEVRHLLRPPGCLRGLRAGHNVSGAWNARHRGVVGQSARTSRD